LNWALEERTVLLVLEKNQKERNMKKCKSETSLGQSRKKTRPPSQNKNGKKDPIVLVGKE